MSKRRALCFIDDEKNELARTKQTLSEDFNVGVGENLNAALEDLGKTPDIFLLDLYYGREIQPAERNEIALAWKTLSEAQTKFDGLLRSKGQSADGGLELAYPLGGNGVVYGSGVL